MCWTCLHVLVVSAAAPVACFCTLSPAPTNFTCQFSGSQRHCRPYPALAAPAVRRSPRRARENLQPRRSCSLTRSGYIPIRAHIPSWLVRTLCTNRQGHTSCTALCGVTLPATPPSTLPVLASALVLLTITPIICLFQSTSDVRLALRKPWRAH